MPTMGRVEGQIKKVEGFEVNIRHPDGHDVHDAMTDVPGYDYDNAAPKEWTLADWRKKRFRRSYPGYQCEVLDGTGHSVSGNTLLRTVRDTY